MPIRFNHSLCLFFKIPFNSFFNQFSVQSRLQKRIFPLNLAGFVILLNLILIGAEAEMKIKGQVTDWAENIEHLGQAEITLLQIICRFGLSYCKLAQPNIIRGIQFPQAVRT